MHDHHGHHHGHGHGHHHHAGESGRRLLLALGLTLGFALVEAVAGWWSGSLALLGDAGHMLTDSASLGLAAAAALLARRAPSMVHSYGLGRAEIVAALVNAMTMLAIVVLISVEALDRFANPQPVQGGVVILVAFIGLLINVGAARLLSGSRDNMNVRAALLHVMGDLLGSVAALVSGAVVLLTGWTTIDPLLSMLIVSLILVAALRVLREALHALMEGVPLHIDLAQVGRAMAGVAGVTSVHDLHIWSLSSSRIALSAHVVVAGLTHWPETLKRLQDVLNEKFGITHVTLQPEVNETLVDIRAIGNSHGDHSHR